MISKTNIIINKKGINQICIHKSINFLNNSKNLQI